MKGRITSTQVPLAANSVGCMVYDKNNVRLPDPAVMFPALAPGQPGEITIMTFQMDQVARVEIGVGIPLQHQSPSP